MKFYTVADLQVNQRIEELTQSGVYLMECIPTGERYVGSTTRSFRLRWKEVRKHSRTGNNKISKLFHTIWEQYGDEGFQFGILEVCDNPREREQYWIGTTKPELNINKSVDTRKPDFDERWEEHYAQGKEEYYQSDQYYLDVCKSVSKRATQFKDRLGLDGKEFVITKSNHRVWRLTNEQTREQFLFQSLSRFCRDNNLDYKAMRRLSKTKYDVDWTLELLTI